MAKKPVNLRIDVELWGAACQQAKAEQRTVTSLVEGALREVTGMRRRDQSSLTAPPTDYAGIPVVGADEMPKGKIVITESVPTAKQLQGRTGLPLSACRRHIDNGTWRELLL